MSLTFFQVIYIVFVIQAWKHAKRPGERKVALESEYFAYSYPKPVK